MEMQPVLLEELLKDVLFLVQKQVINVRICGTS